VSNVYHELVSPAKMDEEEFFVVVDVDVVVIVVVSLL
jgi:hypothetical protein